MSSQQPKRASDLASAALAQANSTIKKEIAASDQLAETLESLQAVIERNADELSRLNSKLKEKRSMFKNVFDNDSILAELEEEYQRLVAKLKENKVRLQSSPEVTALKTQIAELREQKKDIEETLSSHLLNYYHLTGSTSFDTSDGDQWEFTINARVKSKKR